VWRDRCIQRYLDEGWNREQAAAHMVTQNNVPRDHCLTPQDVANIHHTMEIEQGLWHLDPDDAVSVKKQMDAAPDTVFSFRKQVVVAKKQIVALVLGLMTGFMLAAILAFGHGMPVIIDSTFGTNKYMVRQLCQLQLPPLC
jgi:hypothetical protein